MGMQDRDWYRDEMSKRRREELETPRQSRGPVHVYEWPPMGLGASSGWVSTLVRTVIICLAVYGALALVRDFRLGLKPWTKLDPERVQRLLPYLSGKAV